MKLRIRRRHRIEAVVTAVLLAPAVAALLAGCAGEKTAGASEAAADSAAEASPAAGTPAATSGRGVPVSVATLATGRAEETVRAWATVEPWRSADLLAGVSGRVQRVHVGLGDRVRRGDLLLEIDPDLYAAQLAEAEATVRSAEASLEKARRDLERNEELFETQNLSESEIERFRSGLAAAEAAHAQALAARERARTNLADARLAAPFDGDVAMRPPDPGTTVTPGMPLTRLVEIDRVRVTAQVSEQDLASIRTGSPASLTVEGAPGRRFEGKVIALGPQADPQSRQFPVEIEVANPQDHPLKAGMVARVEIVHRVVENVPLLPLDALVEDEDRTGYFLVEGDTARWRDAVLGSRAEGRVALLEGGEAGAQVVVLGWNRLADGARVEVVDDE